MRIGVRGGAIRWFSAPQPRSASLPRRLRCHCSSAPLPTFPRPGARSTPFEPAAVRCSLLFTPPHAPAVRCCRCAGRGEGGEARAAPSSRSPAASWAMPGARSPPLAARSVPFDPGAVWRNRLFFPLCDSLCRCCCSQGKGRRRRERAGSSSTRSRHEKDDDKVDKKKVETVLISTI